MNPEADLIIAGGLEQLAANIEHNFIAGCQAMAGIRKASYIENSTITKFISGCNVSWMNTILKTNVKPQALTQIIEDTKAEFKILKLHAIWNVGVLSNHRESLCQELVSQGLNAVEALVGMVLQPAVFSESVDLPELKLVEIKDPLEVLDFLKPFTAGFAAPPDVQEFFKQYICSKVGEQQEESWFVGYVNGQAVTCAAYLISSQVNLIHSVCTLPEFRCRGYARKAIEVVIKQSGLFTNFPHVLYASLRGASLYKKIGFSEVYSLPRFSLPYP